MKNKNIIFSIITVFIILLIIEGCLRMADFFKHTVIKKCRTELIYTDSEKKLAGLHKEQMNKSVMFGNLVRLSPDMFILEEGKYYKPKPNTTITLVRSSRLEHMSLPLNDNTKRLVDSFEGEKYYQNYDGLSLRKTGGADLKNGSDNFMPILMLGDSFTEGCYVNDEDTFSAYFERLARKDGINVKIYNSGVSGYSTKEEYYRLLDLLPYLKPKMVVLNYFPNDTNVEEHRVVGYWKAKEPQTDTGRFFFKNILIAKTLMKSFYNIFSKPADPRKNAKVMEGWKESLYFLNKIEEVCRNSNIIFIVSAIPPKEQFAFDKKEFYQDKLKKFCDEKGIAFIDPYDYMKNREPSALYLDWDPHFTKKGNAIYAESIYEQIKKKYGMIWR